jgi:hypothetical protein
MLSVANNSREQKKEKQDAPIVAYIAIESMEPCMDASRTGPSAVLHAISQP